MTQPSFDALYREHYARVLGFCRRVLGGHGDAEDPPDPAHNGQAALIESRDANSVARAVDALPEKYRLPILLAYYADASYDDIAASLNLSRNHVGVLPLWGRQRLRKELAEFEEEI